jgi:hypothetical protein
MPIRFVDADEFARATGGYRGSVNIGPAPMRRPKSRDVFLCPNCYEPLTSLRSGVLHCASCDKDWEK